MAPGRRSNPQLSRVVKRSGIAKAAAQVTQLQLISDPWPRNSMWHGAAKKRKRKGNVYKQFLVISEKANDMLNEKNQNIQLNRMGAPYIHETH